MATNLAGREDALAAEAGQDDRKINHAHTSRSWPRIDAQRILLEHGVFHPAQGRNRILAPVGRAGRKDFDQREAQAFLLDTEGLADGLLGLADVLEIVDRDPFDVDRAAQGGQHFADIDRIALEFGLAAEGRRRRDLAEQGRRRHLAGCHAIDGVVDEECA